MARWKNRDTDPRAIKPVSRAEEWWIWNGRHCISTGAMNGRCIHSVIYENNSRRHNLHIREPISTLFILPREQPFCQIVHNSNEASIEVAGDGLGYAIEASCTFSEQEE